MPLKNRAFLELAKDTAMAALPEPLPNARVRGSMVQLYFADSRQHYELWLRSQAGLVELGLHFEGEREDSLARIAVVADAMPEVAARLGPGVEVEEWTERWTRVHETLPLRALDEAFARELGGRMAEFVTALEPVVAGLAPMAPAQARAAGRGRWEGRRPRKSKAAG